MFKHRDYKKQYSEVLISRFSDHLFLVFNRGNIKDASNKRNMHKYLNKCHYDEETEPYCPNFRLGYIANQARENFNELCRTVSVFMMGFILF